jgi:hypothetical protein
MSAMILVQLCNSAFGILLFTLNFQRSKSQGLILREFDEEKQPPADPQPPQGGSKSNQISDSTKLLISNNEKHGLNGSIDIPIPQ